MGLIELLEYVEKRPLMYIKRPKIDLLEAFMGGFFLSLSYSDSVSEKDRLFKDCFYYWLKDKYGFEPCFSWGDMIKTLAKTESDGNELTVFFRELNLFKREKLTG